MSSPYDLVGPVLPQALRLARYQALATLPQNADDIQSENDTLNQTPSPEEERLLSSNASVVTALENLFSWREKDRTCRTSKLSRAESVRFQRAMYRIWIMSVLFGPRRFTQGRRTVFSEGDDEDHSEDLEKSWEDQKTFLKPFSSQELFQIRTLAWFLILTAGWAVTAEGGGLGGTLDVYEWNGMYLFAGPHVVLRCYEDATHKYLPTEHLFDDGVYTKFILQPLSQIFEERHVDVPIGSVGTILDDIHGEHDRCHHCGGAGIRSILGGEMRFLPDLYNETNWDDLKGQLDREFLVARNLSYNRVEKPIMQALRGDWRKLVREMLACKSDEYAQWSKEDWNCTSCWSSFFWDTLWRWRLAQKRRAREPIGVDCGYGYDCQEQCFERGLEHAKQFNHLCRPVEKMPPVRLRG